MKRKYRYSSSLILFIIIVILLAFLVFGNKTWWRLMYMHKEIKILEEEISKVKKDNSKLEREIRNLETDYGYIEQIAREELGLTLPGEIEYRFIPLNEEDNPK